MGVLVPQLRILNFVHNPCSIFSEGCSRTIHLLSQWYVPKYITVIKMIYVMCENTTKGVKNITVGVKYYNNRCEKPQQV